MINELCFGQNEFQGIHREVSKNQSKYIGLKLKVVRTRDRLESTQPECSMRTIRGCEQKPRSQRNKSRVLQLSSIFPLDLLSTFLPVPLCPRSLTCMEHINRACGFQLWSTNEEPQQGSGSRDERAGQEKGVRVPSCEVALGWCCPSTEVPTPLNSILLSSLSV